MLLVLLIAGWVAGIPLSAQTVVELAPDQNTPNASEFTSLGDETTGVSFAFDKGDGGTPPMYYTSGGGAIRAYAGNTITMTAPKGSIVTKIEFFTASYKYSNDTTLVVPKGTTVTYDASTYIYTWENLTAESTAVFSVVNVVKTQFRIKSIKVYLSAEGDVKPKPKAPVFARASGEFYKTFDLTITDANDPATTIRYTLDGSKPTATTGTVYTGPITITEGADVTVKAVCVRDKEVSLVTSATYTYVAKHLLKFKTNNASGINSVDYSSSSEYGSFNANGEAYITDGQGVVMSFMCNEGYRLRSVKLNDANVDISSYKGLQFTMPASDVEVVADVVYDPSSPSDPESPAAPVTTYKLSVVANPVGAASVSGAGSYAANASVRVSASAKRGYVFTGWTRDGEPINSSSSFNYTMPASDVVLTANFVYNPTNPSDPQQPTLKHPLTAIASPAGSATFSLPASEIEFGKSYTVRVTPKSGYQFKGWILNGVAQEEKSTAFTGTMTDAGAHLVALLVFNPSSPGNPGANYYNAVTGQVIIDDFVQGYLSNALKTVAGGTDYSNVNSIIVKGLINSSDYYTLRQLTNASTIDISRTGGTGVVPGSAFRNMAMSNLLLPSNVTSIGSNAFDGCSNLTAITVYAMEPPACTSNTFSNFTNKANCTIYVPEEAVELYKAAQYWKEFNIMPITNDAHTLQVNLPANGTDGRYKNNTIELVNINSAVRQRYVITDRQLYTFNGLRKDEQYNIYMYSRAGLEIGRIENVIIPDNDFAVTFNTLKQLYNVEAKVVSPDGEDFTAQTKVEWLKPLEDGTTTYLRKAVSLGEIPEGQALVCRVTLSEKLGIAYKAPVDVQFTVSNEQNVCTVTLEPLRSVTLKGVVVDGDGQYISGASVSATQTLNGKFQKTYTAKTNRQGEWTMSVIAAPETRLVIAANECVNKLDTIGAFAEDETIHDMGKTMMKSIVGARVTYGFTYQAAGSDVKQTSYSDYRNVAVSVYNITQDRPQKELSVQYPTISVLDETVNPGDQLRLTAVSKTNAFSPIERVVTVGDNRRAEATFDVMSKGCISASFGMTDNPAVVAMLYSAKGELLKKMAYTEAKANFADVDDGDYIVVTMGQSELMNSMLRLSSFDEIGLAEGKEYVKNNVKVESGKIASVHNEVVPSFDESLFSYTTTSTAFSSNKSSITNGKYLTLSSSIDFKGVYKPGVSNVRLVVDLPDACDFVEKSVIQGPKLIPYTLSGKRLTIQLGDSYQAQTRFCVIPTASGSFNATASVVFDYNNNSVTQPIGSSAVEVKDIEISAPTTIASTTFTVTGTARANSTVKVYEGGTLLGQGKANAAGTWMVDCELADAYNLSTHSVFAEITTPQGNVMPTETKQVTYDMNAIQVSKVTMYHLNPEMGRTYESVFDFLNPKSSPTQWIVYYPNKKFTYTVEFTNNDPERISNVVLYVHTADGKFVPCDATYDANKKLWYTEIDMGSSSDNYYPVNCSVDFDYVSEKLFDTEEVAQATKDYSDIASKLTANVANFDNKVANADTSVDGEIDDIEQTDTDDWASTLDNIIGDIAGNDLAETNNDQSYNYFSSMSDAELDSYIAGLGNIDYEEELSKVKNAIDIYLTNMSYETGEGVVLEDGTKLTMKTCEGLTADALLERGFEYSKTTSGKGVYVLATEEGSEVVDFDNNCYTVIVYGKSLQSIAKSANRKASNIESVLDKFNDIIDKINAYYQPIASAWEKTNEKLFDFVEKFKTDYVKNSFDFGRKKAIYNAKLTKLNRLKTELKSLNSLSLEYQLKLGEIETYKKEVKAAKNLMNSAGRLKTISGAAYKSIKPLPGFFAKKIPLVKYADAIYTFVSVARTYQKVYLTIPNPCKDDEAKANALRDFCIDKAVETGVVAGVKLGTSAVLDILTFGSVAASAGTAGVSMLTAAGAAIANILVNISIDALYNIGVNKRLAYIRAERDKLECVKKCGTNGYPECPDDNNGGNGNGNGNGNNGGGAHQSNSTSDHVIIDPSGYVYEAVPENRVEGVQATIYYKEEVEDIYGDKHEDIVMWNAEDYAQKNPLFTDENGMYRWDVPQGLWQVKFEKDGYVTAYSEWLPVPPPQLEVNIGITQNKQPEVTEARAYEQGVEVQFDKYMDPATLTDANISVTAGGNKLAGEIQLVNAALADEFALPEDADAMRYASRIRFVPEQTLASTTGELRLTVSRNVKSYAGIPMTETYSQTLDVEKEVQQITAEDVKMLYGAEKELTIYALPSEAASGRKLHIANSSALVASLDNTELTLDAEGKAVVKVKGDLPGRTQLSFTIDDVTAKGQCMVDVMTEIITAEAPTASRASGTAVYRGSKVELATDSKNATIYFTTDGSCPCDENGTRRKYSVPIVIDNDTHIKAMTMVGDNEVSEVKEFSYVVKKADMDVAMTAGWTWMSHNIADGITSAQLAADAAVTRVKSQTQEVVRDPQLGLVGTLSTLEASKSYKVEASAAPAAQRISGVAWNPANPIALNSGWNWLGYPAEQTMTLDEAFATTAVEKLDVVVGQDGFAQYDGEHWVGTLSTLAPGKGYMYQSQSEKKVVYNTTIVSKAHALNTPGIAGKLPLAYDKHKYPSVMAVVATVCDSYGMPADNADYQLAAFCGTECRGIGQLTGGMLMMSVYGNVGDRIMLQVTDRDGNSVLANETLNFSESVLGNVDAPYTICVGNATAIGTTYTGNIRLSVVGGRLFIHGVATNEISSVELFDINGKKMMHETHVNDNGIDISSLGGGVYVVAICNNGNYTYHKIAVR